MTEAPKPKPPTTRAVPIQPTAKESTPSTKQPYIRKPHLTDRPFKNEALKKLRDQMPAEPRKSNFSGRSSRKTQTKTTK